MSWETLGLPAPDALTAARLQLHWAAQIPAAVGNTFVAPQPDFSHLALTWDGAQCALFSASGKGAFRAGIRLIDLHLLLMDGAGRIAGDFALSGRTIEQGLSWLVRTVERATGASPPKPVLPDHVLPEHPVGAGEPFRYDDAEAFGELTRWYADADIALQSIQKRERNAGPTRCWPHHFDIASVIMVDKDKKPEEARTVGVGLSPGDGSYAEPYFYVTPWPKPTETSLPDLPIGHWHTEDWVGAVLPGSQLVGVEEEKQEMVTDGFLRSAVSSSLELMLE